MEKKNRKVLLYFFLLLAVFFGVYGFYRTFYLSKDYYFLKGTVKSPSGKGIKDFTVQLTDTLYCKTDTAGHYKFSRLAPGNYTLRYESRGSGYSGGERELSLTENTVLDIESVPCLINQCYGGSGVDSGRRIIETADGCLVVAGVSYSTDGILEGKRIGGEKDCDLWIIKIDPRDGNILFNRCYGGTGSDYASGLLQTPQGDILVVGATNSVDGDLAYRAGKKNYDFWVLQLDLRAAKRADTIIYNQCYGGSGGDYAADLAVMKDGSVVLIGSTNSNDGDLSGVKKTVDYDFWVLQLDLHAADKKNSILFSRCYGGSSMDYGNAIMQTSDGFIVVSGSTASCDGDLQQMKDGEDYDFWVLQLDLSALNHKQSIRFNQCYGGSDNDYANGMLEHRDGNIVLVGSSKSSDGDLNGLRRKENIYSDFWVLKIDVRKKEKRESILFSQCYGGAIDDYANGVVQMDDGCIAVAGYTISTDGDLTGLRDRGYYSSDLWVLILDLSHNEKQSSIQFSRCYGGKNYDDVYGLTATADGCLALIGYTSSTDGDLTGMKRGIDDFWVLKINRHGEYQLDK